MSDAETHAFAQLAYDYLHQAMLIAAGLGLHPQNLMGLEAAMTVIGQIAAEAKEKT